MASSFPQMNPQRIRSYILRLPLCTRLICILIVAFWVAGISHGFQNWASLAPEAVFSGSMHRLNTYPFLHLGLIHTLANLLALTPLLERFESEHGTLVTIVMFTGPFATFPAAIYLLIAYIFGIHTPILGASIWVFLLLASSIVQQSKTQPYIAPPAFLNLPQTYRIPTAALPILIILLTSFLSTLHVIPATSLLGHLAGALIGYLWGLGYIKFLAPPEKVLRWIEAKLNLLGRIPHYVSVDQKVFGRYGILPQTASVPVSSSSAIPMV
ncbi:uncharacterized protein PV09_07595 [Verruconis gallopava]|uniref:rhomboid protease n=1 Tax=Verruconis gallopava TaxID=253628 RepID=A0A0D2A369_9PEZI|nr:uncharacterized protein PV09_07595 [Verruconis gallopava]KIW00835.1 hypothetical protein PV09_07595 [Verruconis gallopava]